MMEAIVTWFVVAMVVIGMILLIVGIAVDNKESE